MEPQWKATRLLEVEVATFKACFTHKGGGAKEVSVVLTGAKKYVVQG